MKKEQLEQCINEYGKDIYSFCRHLTCNQQEADDLYQDTFLKALELGNEIDFEKNPKSYLLSIAIRIWKNRKRKFAWRKRILESAFADRTKENDMEICQNVLEKQVFQKEKNQLVRQVVDALPEKLKVVTLLYYMEEVSIPEIASVLKLPQGTIKSRLYQARKQIKKELEEVLDE